MTTTNHTPTPWQVNHGDPLQVCDASDVRGCAPIAFMDIKGGRVEAKHNAAFIVRACNAHDELIAALSGLANSWQLALSKDAAEKDAFREALLNARAALAKVGNGGQA